MTLEKQAADDMSGTLIISTVAEHVGTITLNRPKALNAWNLEMAQQFLSVVTGFGRDDDVRAIVLRGAGKVFSAGGDIREMMDDVRRGEDRAAYFRAPLSAFGEMVLAVRDVPKPVLAAVHGAVAGFAFNLMLACDLRVAAETTRFAQAFIGIGLSPDGGGTWFLPRVVGHARACELALLPTELDARTALEWGLINRVVAMKTLERDVDDVARRLAGGPRSAMARAKALLNQAHDHDLARHIEMERLAQIENAASPDFEEGLTAFLEKRRPAFPG